MLLDRDHPLASKKGHVYEHRRVLYDKLGGVLDGCYWCGVALTWETCVVDHLNEAKADNAECNLAAVCAPCNRARGAFLDMALRTRHDRLDEVFALFRQWNESIRK